MSAEAPVNPDKVETASPDAPKSMMPISPSKKRGRPSKLSDKIQGTKNDLADSAITGDDVVIIHFLKDGFTAGGQLWYVGQEFRVRLGSPEHEAQKDRNGNCWFEMSELDQIARYGEVYFKPGPWPGLPWDDLAKYMEGVDPNDFDAVARVQKRVAREAAKRGKVPHTK